MRAARIKRGRLRAWDSRFDAAASALAHHAQLLSGNNPRNPPYSLLFGSVTLRQAKTLGATNAVKWARPVIARAMNLEDRLGPAAVRLEACADMLESLGAERDTIAVVTAVADTRRIRLHSELEDLVAETEQQIFGFLPRTEAKETIRALLSPHASRPGKPKQQAVVEVEEEYEAEVA